MGVLNNIIDELVSKYNPEYLSGSINWEENCSMKVYSADNSNKLRQILEKEYSLKNISVNSIVNLSSYNDKLFFSKIFNFTGNILHHYTNLESLLKIFQTKKIRLTSIIGMNDKSELHYSYYNFLKRRFCKNDFSAIHTMNNRYVLSCTTREDDLNQWRLYGNDGTGCCLSFCVTMDNKDNYHLGRIIYGEDFINDFNKMICTFAENENKLLTFKNMYLWRNYLKLVEFKDENEVRLLFLNLKSFKRNEYLINPDSQRWFISRDNILSNFIDTKIEDLPLKPVRITLGPKIRAKEANFDQISYYVNHLLNLQIEVVYSKIRFYR